ncbi:carboxylesterase BioH (pimeloyl-CoA synthesis) [Nitrosospira sp. Nsp5]|uniref:Pimeloyl-[acyl-carrier protein] methyl ester esterase n=1 Tax=Nitrosospira multiformis TaxID=1231 RepID=A0ABY0TIT5_9PROT|nr:MULTISPECIES: pimeloyl-ACP methyl ester esterase BioH [Nitrosospira]PTR05412.1 carboxylesterase BioH (pimeloyl-CoA synthesis) [Nitrosospira sp. Nsp5]SDQ90511.1 carboxylesterase BioH (pimeloyl-CoA synthesis) [Nitrosospira multiformis]
MSLYVEVTGTGPDLVLLHGWAMHGGIWNDVRTRLAKHFRLHLVDLPGHGFSPACEPGTLEHVVEMVADILPASCIVCGWSLGGQVAIELALREPQRVKKLALISTTPCFVKREDWQWGMEAATLQLFMQNLKRDYATTLNRFLTLQVSGSDDTIAVLTQLRVSVLQRDQPDGAALQMGLKILLMSDLRKKIRNIMQPAVLMHGENDVIIHPDAAKWMNQQLGNSELVMLPGCGHAPFLAYPDQFITGMTRLLS